MLTWDPEAPVMPRSCGWGPFWWGLTGGSVSGARGWQCVLGRSEVGQCDGDGQAGHTQPGASCLWAALPGL